MISPDLVRKVLAEEAESVSAPPEMWIAIRDRVRQPGPMPVPSRPVRARRGRRIWPAAAWRAVGVAAVAAAVALMPFLTPSSQPARHYTEIEYISVASPPNISSPLLTPGAAGYGSPAIALPGSVAYR